MTCMFCGADAVDASGVCQACGRRAEDVSVPAQDRHQSFTNFESYDSADSVAATREADIPLPARRVTAAPASPPPPAGEGTGVKGPRSGVSGASGGSGVYGGAAPSTNRYCGTCGAEIEPGRQFCGQCGTPVAAEFDNPGARATLAGGPGRGTYPPAARSAYADTTSPGYDDWSPADQDAPTEQFTPPFGAPFATRRQSGAFDPYGSGAAQTGGGMSRETRAFLGILCILGALISGAGAIILAFIH